MNTPENKINPDSYYEKDLDYNVYNCLHCNENHSIDIYFDHLSNGNICSECLNHEELQSALGMDANAFSNYKNKVLKSMPVYPV